MTTITQGRVVVGLVVVMVVMVVVVVVVVASPKAGENWSNLSTLGNQEQTVLALLHHLLVSGH